jgi:4-amino-4-deoxy-L-arabinose transferase-like glycosyltransferase
MIDNTSSHRRWNSAAAVLLLLFAAWLFWRTPLSVPPGMEMDELIEIQIAKQVLGGDWRPFYEAGQGREGLYHYWLAGWLTLTGRNVFTLRMASTTLTLLGLAAGYALMRRLFGRAVALTSLAIGATSFWVLFAARSGLRSTALLLLAALAGYLFWRGLSPVGAGLSNRRFAPALGGHKGRPYNWLFFGLAGMCLGLTFYAYTAARVLPAVFILFILYLAIFHRHRLMGRWRWLLVWGLVAALVIAPFLLYLQAHPEADAFDFLDFNRPLAALQTGDPEPALQTSLATLGMFAFRGDPLIFDNVPGRPVFDPLLGALFLAGVIIAAWRFRQPAYAFVLLWLPISLLPGMLSQPAPNFYRTVGAQVVAFVFPALALAEVGRFVRRRWSGVAASASLAAGLALVLAVQLVGTWRAYFVDWPQVEGIRFFWQSGLSETARHLENALDDSPAVICTELTYEYDSWWRPAWQSMETLLNRDDLALRYATCRSTLILPADFPARYFFLDTGDPASLLPPEFQGDWLAEAEPITGVFPPGEGVALRVTDPPDNLVPDLRSVVGVAWVGPEAGGGQAVLPVYFGQNTELALIGYARTPENPRPGESIRLVTAWEVEQTPEPRLVLFTHLLADSQTVVAQQDGLPLTSQSLRPGDRFLVLHDQITIPADASPGEYLLAIGIYSGDTMQRLPLYHMGRAYGDRLFLQPVEVNP